MEEIPRFSKNNDEAKIFFEQNGCVVLNDLFSDEVIINLQNSIKKIFQKQIGNNLENKYLQENNGFDKGVLEYFENNDDLRTRFYNVIQGITSLYKYASNDDILSIMTKYGITEPVLYIPPQLRMDLPNDDRYLQPVHQEIRGTRSPKMFFAITALCDITNEKGAMKVGLGSHKLGPITPTIDEKMKYQYIPSQIYEEKYPLIQIPIKKGETIILNKYTLHASSSNNSDESRWQMISRYEDALDMPYLDGDDTIENKFDLQKNSHLIQ